MLTYQQLKTIQTVENNEPMVSLKIEAPELILHIPADMIPYSGEDICVRQSVVALLKAANRLIQTVDDEYCLAIYYGYRHPSIQEKYFEDMRAKILSQHLGADTLWLDEKTHQFIAKPDVAGHPTGGAVDVSIARCNQPIPMGTEVGCFLTPERIPFHCATIDASMQKNRELLRHVMFQAGFAPFDGEWWHFSYGDKEWAYYYQKLSAFYDRVFM